MNEFAEALKTISEKELRKYFQKLIDQHLETMNGTLNNEQLTLLQARVTIYKEIREEFISIRNDT